MINELRLWGKKLKDGVDLAHNFHFENSTRLPKNVSKIIFFGMGGSGISGRIIKTFLDRKTEMETFVIDGPTVPNFVDSKSLAIVVSYSGNTWETVEALKLLAEKFIPTIVLSHGGQIAEYSEKNNIPFALLPDSLQPRFSLGNCLGFILTLLELMEILYDGSKLIDIFIGSAKSIIPKFEDESYFKDFLEIIGSRSFCHVWGVRGDSAAFAYRAQTQLNENSKIEAVTSFLPELVHNLVVGFTDSKEKSLVILFYSDFLISKLDVVIDSVCKILEERGVDLYKPPILGDNWESQLFNMILWSDFASFYLGRYRGVDTVDVKIIEELKTKYQKNDKNIK